MQEKINDAEYIIKQIHVTHIKVALNYVTKSLKRIDMETPTTLRQEYYTITKKNYYKNIRTQ